MKAFDLLPTLIGLAADDATGAADPAGLPSKVRQRLEDILHHASAYHFGPADRLIPWVAPETPVADPRLRSTIVTSVLTTIWDADRATRRAKLAAAVVELVKANKRVLLIAPDGRLLTDVLLAAAKGLRGAGLQYRSFLCCYDPPAIASEGGINLRDLLFDVQVSAFLGKSQSDKAGLRRKLERYLELAPILRYKAEKQKDLDEVRLLEWRLLTALGDAQAHIKKLQGLLSTYEALPAWQRLSMQVMGSNVATMKENCVLYEAQKREHMNELEIVQARINELKPEARIDPEMRPEYEELKDEIERLGGAVKVREVLAMEEDVKRLPFLQAKRVLAATAPRVIGDAIFRPIRYDVLVVDEGPRIPLPLLLACACLARERIVLAGDPQEIPPATPTPGGMALGWPTALAGPAAAPARP
ncbi:MAG: hypothetical protein EPO02_12015 [Nitrospirae bacterium]|nr:MAG: hypothetical protein EPO02_12015 [Nitrospirota bacterium]